MFRMSWLSARLAAALFAVPVMACSGGGTTTTSDPTTTGPSIKSQWQWCGTPGQAWAQSRPDKPTDKGAAKPNPEPGQAPPTKKAKKPECPDEIKRDLEPWEYNADRSALHKQQRSPMVCCYDRGAKIPPPPVPDAGPPDARRRIYRPPVKGRPLLIGESFTTASVVEGAHWSAGELELVADDSMPSELRAELAGRWLDAALAEHASIASFARNTIELLSVGAPPQLVAAAQQASLDEIQHARLCFAVASMFGGETFAAGALTPAAPRELDLAGVAITTFEEGCVCETVAALEAASLVTAARDPRIREVLETMRVAGRRAAGAWLKAGPRRDQLDQPAGGVAA